MNKIIDSDTDLRTFSGDELLAIVKTGKRGKNGKENFFAACDEIDRRVLNRVIAGKPLTKPIVEALAVLDKRGVPHTGPLAKDAIVLTASEKAVKSPESTVGVPDEYRYSDGAAALVAPKVTTPDAPVDADPVAARKALIREANEVAKVLAEQLCTKNDKGYVKNLITATRQVKMEMGLV